jgi:hypothetical protein
MGAPHEAAAAAATPRFFTVQCGYASWHACTVVVAASTVAQACERAIEEANAASAWRPLDACGPTYVDAVAEGDDVDPWMPSGPPIAVPPAFAEHRDTQILQDALVGLLDWAARMGGCDAEVWRVAERAVRRSAFGDGGE